jgi:hypothetical protein
VSKIHYATKSCEPLCRRVPNWEYKAADESMVTCAWCKKLMTNPEPPACGDTGFYEANSYSCKLPKGHKGSHIHMLVETPEVCR